MTILLLCGLLLPAAWAANKPVEPIDDVRVLIDISGSMKRTDPKNLRRPALRLFTSLLPKGAEAGVWTFGQWTNMLVKHGPVDKAWKDNARKAADKISSHGLRTNIEDVLRRASWDWKRPDESRRRSLILLTDGLVDVSKNTDENTASRARILNEILPRLQQAKVTVHTIALSSESDAALLEQLAAATGGGFETIESADGLERLFLRMFEKVSKADTLPLTDNKVTVDNSIHEATFLVFRKAGSPPTTVTPPKGKAFGQQHPPAGVQWFEDDRYDLITVQDPQPGQWTINADVDPDNRVMVVTDLRMVSTELPSVIAAGRPLLFTVHLEQEGKPIQRPDFLQFVSATLTQQSHAGDEQQWRLRDDGKRADLKAHDGIFSTRLDDSLGEGDYTFILDVDGTTFKRTRRQQVKVLGQPVKAQLEPQGDDRFALTLIPYASLLDTETLHVTVEHVLPSGRLEKAQAKKVSAAEWRLEINAHEQPGEHEFTALISAQDNDGNPLKLQLGPIGFEAGEAAPTQHIEAIRAPVANHQEDSAKHETTTEPHAESHADKPHEKATPKKKPASKKTAKKAHKAEPEDTAEQHPPAINWGMIIGIIIGLTALLSGLIFAGIKLWPKLKAKRDTKKPDTPPPEATRPPPPPPAEEETPTVENTDESPEEEVPDLDQAIDDLLADGDDSDTADTDDADANLDPEFDLGAEVADETPELEIPEEGAAEVDEATHDADEESSEDLAELPADLLMSEGESAVTGDAVETATADAPVETATEAQPDADPQATETVSADETPGIDGKRTPDEEPVTDGETGSASDQDTDVKTNKDQE